MDTYDDIFSELEPLFDGDKWDHRKISTDQIQKVDDKQSIPMTDQDEQKEVVRDVQKISIEESDKEVKKGDTDLKTDVDQFLTNQKVMDTYDDIFSKLEPLFDGDEWDYRKISIDQIHKTDDKQLIPMTDQDEQKEVVPDAQKIVIEESDKEVKKGDTDMNTYVDRFVMIHQKHHKKNQ
ncbi:hypothetical protein HAX54_023943 [Datura stramonium]|uniref:Uncharacterized protein n=1 Tax=Datura stramonium TaxID=4076 RepID=A0ABS8UZI7_DATST|nr:hypothetical protein [Datura stramonium]